MSMPREIARNGDYSDPECEVKDSHNAHIQQKVAGRIRIVIPRGQKFNI
jgi:hypothetical protein